MFFSECDVTDVTDPTLVGSVDYETMRHTCVRRCQELCYNRLNYLELQIRILATVTECTSDLHYLALKPRYDGARAMDTALLLVSDEHVQPC